MLWSGTSSKFGTLPAIMATCQYWETFLQEAPCLPTFFSKFGTLPAITATCQCWDIFLEESPCPPATFGKMPKIVGNLPKVPPHDPPWFWSDPYLTSVPKIGPEKTVFCGFLTVTFDLDLPKTNMRSPMSMYIPKIRSIGLLAASGEVVTEERTAEKKLFFVLFWPWPLTFDLDFPKTCIRSLMSIYILKIRFVGLLAAAVELVTDERTDRTTDHYYGWTLYMAIRRSHSKHNSVFYQC